MHSLLSTLALIKLAAECLTRFVDEAIGLTPRQELMRERKIERCEVFRTKSDDSFCSPAMATLSSVQILMRDLCAQTGMCDYRCQEEIERVQPAKTMFFAKRGAYERLDLARRSLGVQFEQRAQRPGGDGDDAIGFCLFSGRRECFSEYAERVRSRTDRTCYRRQRLASVPGMLDPSRDFKRFLWPFRKKLLGRRAATYVFGANVFRRHGAVPNAESSGLARSFFCLRLFSKEGLGVTRAGTA